MNKRFHPRTGLTVIELTVVMTILAVSVSIFSGMVVTTARQRAINRENAVAAEGARFVIESMHNMPFGDVFATYNSWPDDDPDGEGTAPGHRFAVAGLTPIETSPDGLHGTIYFPCAMVTPPAPEGGVGGGLGGGGLLGGGKAPPPPEPEMYLCEDFVDETMGMPRDLNGDSMVDALDHSSDYVLLPVRIEVEWAGTVGARTLKIDTMLTRMVSVFE